MKAWVGIDPGQTGAIALLREGDSPLVEDYVDAVTMSDVLRAWMAQCNVQLVALESVHSMPKQGVSSTFKFGTNFGIWQGILAALHLPHALVRPTAWQRGIVRKSDGPDAKARSLTVARRLFPAMDLSRKKDHGRADALLLAWWARQQ